MENRSEIFFIGVDVGTGSVRAALVNNKGKIIKISTCPIKIWNPKPHYYEQSSDNIWFSCCKTIKVCTVFCLNTSHLSFLFCLTVNSYLQEICVGIEPQNIKGIGFDATCSLVVLDTEGQPLSISPQSKNIKIYLYFNTYKNVLGQNEQNIIMWMDHRAEMEAKQINETKNSVLQYVGGKISLEMEIPKLMWLKKHLKTQCWDKVGLLFDLPDFLTWKATGAESRY